VHLYDHWSLESLIAIALRIHLHFKLSISDYFGWYGIVLSSTKCECTGRNSWQDPRTKYVEVALSRPLWQVEFGNMIVGLRLNETEEFCRGIIVLLNF